MSRLLNFLDSHPFSVQVDLSGGFLRLVALLQKTEYSSSTFPCDRVLYRLHFFNTLNEANLRRARSHICFALANIRSNA